MLKSVLKSGSALVIVLLLATPAFAGNHRTMVLDALSATNTDSRATTTRQAARAADQTAAAKAQDEASKTDAEKRDELQRTVRLCGQRQQIEGMIGSGQLSGPMPNRMPDQRACDKATSDLAALDKPPTNAGEAAPEVTPEPPVAPVQ